MNDQDRLSGALQENILTALCFDDAHCRLIRHAITKELFESTVFREVAGHAINFIDQFGEAIKDHLPDHLEDILNGDDKRKATTYRKLVDNLFLAKDGLNVAYVVSQLQKFVRQQNLKSAVVQAVEAIEDGRVDAAEVALQKGLTSQVVSFDLGLKVNDPTQALRFLEQGEQGFLTGIDALDDHGATPARKALWMLVAARGRGKSWGLLHIGKWALLQRLTTVVITLEMSEELYAQRALQMFFSVSKREAEVRVTRLNKDGEGSLSDIFFDQVERPTLKDPNIAAKLATRVKREFRRRPPFVIKGFPSGTLTLSGLEAYLDGLERFHKIIPDVIIVDYPDLMALDPKDLRTSIGQVIMGLRGIAQKRNAAMVVASQGNRTAESATTVTGDMIAEDISKLAHADVLVTLSQTEEEEALGLARILVEKSRNDKSGVMALISQAYSLGQFCLDSVVLHKAKEYWDMLDLGPSRGRRAKQEDDQGEEPTRREKAPQRGQERGERARGKTRRG